MITQVLTKRVSYVGRSLLVIAFGLVPMSGCGGVVYAVSASGATSSLEEARELNAERLAPFEFYMAEQHLLKAREEAAQGDYGDASDLASDAEEFANKAARLAREAHRSAGR